MTTAKITKDHTRKAKHWAMSRRKRPSVETERAYAQALADAQALRDAQFRDHCSVLPAAFDDGSSMVVSAMSGGMDYVDGMPRKLTVTYQGPDGKEVMRDYLSVKGRVRARASRLSGHEPTAR